MALVRRWIEEGWNQRNPQLIDELFSDDFVVRGAPGKKGDLDYYRRFVADLQSAFPDFHFGIRDCIAAGDIVVLTYRVTGTHLGEGYSGQEPTGKELDTVVIDLWRVSDGRISERLNTLFNHLAIENQLDFDPAYIPE